MEHLKDLYIALTKRIEDLKERQDELENPLIVEIRLDLEQLLMLICQEKNIHYDGIFYEMDPNEVLDKLWSKNKDGD